MTLEEGILHAGRTPKCWSGAVVRSSKEATNIPCTEGDFSFPDLYSINQVNGWFERQTLEKSRKSSYRWRTRKEKRHIWLWSEFLEESLYRKSLASILVREWHRYKSTSNNRTHWDCATWVGNCETMSSNKPDQRVVLYYRLFLNFAAVVEQTEWSALPTPSD